MMDIPELHDVAAEESVIASVLIAPDMFYQVSEILHVEDFYIERHRWVWKAFEKIIKDGGGIDIVTVSSAIGDRLVEFGGPAKLTQLVSADVRSYNAESYAETVKDYSERRKGVLFSREILQDSFNKDKKFDLSNHLVDIALSKNGDGRKSAKEAASSAIDMILSPRSMTTGVKSVDKFIGGYFPSELALLAGYQGAGKSAIMKQSARANADAGAFVQLMSFEESAAQVWLKMACADMQINPSILRSNKVTEKAKQDVIDYAASLGDKYDGKIVIYEKARTPSGIMAACLRESPDIVFIDTLKNVSGQGKESLQIWYDYVVEFLRTNVAKRVQSRNSNDSGIPVVLLHHLNRSAANQGREPVIQDLKYAGESDADSVHMLYSPDERMPNQKIAMVKWKCGKVRFGAIGSVELGFNLPEQKFYDTETRDI